MSEETVQPAFEGRERPLLSYGIAFPAATARHLDGTFQASRVYVICSGSLSRNTNVMDQLETALGPDRLVGHWIGMQSHTLWSEVLQIAEEVQTVHADLLLTVGAGSLTDGAKIIALVGIPFSLILLFIIHVSVYILLASLYYPLADHIYFYSQPNIPLRPSQTKSAHQKSLKPLQKAPKSENISKRPLSPSFPCQLPFPPANTPTLQAARQTTQSANTASSRRFVDQSWLFLTRGWQKRLPILSGSVQVCAQWTIVSKVCVRSQVRLRNPTN